MQFGAQLSNYATTWADIQRTVTTLEAGRWHSLWFSDHFMPPGNPKAGHGPALEGWTLLTAVAAVTHRLRLGVLATGNTYRSPALLAKMCTTLDHITGGRMILGLGAGWYEREHRAYGWDFPSLKERSDRLEEATDLIRLLFTKPHDEYVSFAGTHYQLNDAPLSPPSSQAPHIPILIGGNGEKRTLRTCAKSGDIFNLDFWHPGGVDVFRHKTEVTARHCESFGRDPSEVMKTVSLPFRLFETERDYRAAKGMPWYCWGTAEMIQDLLGAYIDAGAEEVMLCGVPSKPALWQRIEADVLSVFEAHAE